MVVLMACASLYAVLQLAVLGSATRSTRIGTAMLAVATGCVACGAVTIAAELIYTRSVAVLTGQELGDVVQTASYTVDPFIEEIVKILPLVLIGVLGIRRRVQWGLTDFLIIGAGIGSGFALAEALLRFSWHAASALSDHHGGMVLAISLSAPTIRGPLELLGSWLPAPAGSWDLFGTGTANLNLHLLWTTIAGVGIGVVVRFRGWRRFLGLIPLLYAAVDHAVNNLDGIKSPTGIGGFAVAVMEAVRLRLPLLIFLLLIATTVIDLRVLRPIRRQHPETLTAAERSGSPAVRALGRYALVWPPWTTMVAARFALVRRAAWYALADRPGGDPPELVAAVADLANRIDRSADSGRWRQAVGDLTRNRVSLSGLIRNPWVIVWLALGVLPIIYFVIAGTPLTGQLQRWMQATPILILAGVLLAVGVAYGIRNLVLLLREAPARAREPWTEGLLRITLRILIGAASCAMSVAALFLLLAGTGRYDTTVRNYHLIDALSDALFLASMLLLMLALFAMFPPVDGLVLAGIGRVIIVGSARVAITRVSQAIILGAVGWLLMNVSGGINPDDYEDYEEEHYGENQRGGRGGAKGGRKQRGRGGGDGDRPGDHEKQNDQVDDAIREAERRLGRKLDQNDRDKIHRELHRPGTGSLGYRDLVDLIVDEFG